MIARSRTHPRIRSRPLENVLRHVLNWFHETVGLPWAWSIVAITVLVRMLLVPLTVRQIHSMQNLQRFAPQMKAIQQKYKSDKQKQNEELMKFYKENKINPAASCLPILFQFPVFISLYFVLRTSRIPSLLHETAGKYGHPFTSVKFPTNIPILPWGMPNSRRSENLSIGWKRQASTPIGIISNWNSGYDKAVRREFVTSKSARCKFRSCCSDGFPIWRRLSCK